MAGGEIYIRFVAGITPNVITHRRVHVLASRVQIFFIAFDLVDEGCFRDRDTDIVLLASLFSGWRGRVTTKSAHVFDSLLPKFSMRSACALAQAVEFYIGDVNTWMNAQQLRSQS